MCLLVICPWARRECKIFEHRFDWMQCLGCVLLRYIRVPYINGMTVRILVDTGLVSYIVAIRAARGFQTPPSYLVSEPATLPRNERWRRSPVSVGHQRMHYSIRTTASIGKAERDRVLKPRRHQFECV